MNFLVHLESHNPPPFTLFHLIFLMWCFDSGKISCILFSLSTGNRLVITVWEFVSSHKPLEERVCLLLDSSHCFRRKTYVLFLHPWQRFMNVLQIFQLLGKILLFFCCGVVLFFGVIFQLTVGSIVASSPSCLSIQEEETGQGCEFRPSPSEAGLCRACSPAASYPTELPLSRQLLDPSQWRGHGESPFIPLSPPHCAFTLDTHSPKWVFSRTWKPNSVISFVERGLLQTRKNIEQDLNPAFM